MTTKVLTPTADSYVSQLKQKSNFGSEKYLNLRGQSGEFRRSFFKFSLPADLKNSTVADAALVVFLRGDWPGANTVTAKRITGDWAEGKLNWDNQPNVHDDNTATASVTGGTGGQALIFDVTAMISDVAGGAGWKGIRLTNSNSSLRQLHSREGANHGYHATLTVTYYVPPDAPRNLRPSGEQAVTEAAPMVLWDSVTPTESQVQIGTVEDFTSGIVYDSGAVANSVTQWDTAEDGSPPALADNTTYYWRVRIRDENGSQSNWSMAAEFQRRTHGALVITYPASDGDVVDTTTPTITHTFTGRTQAYTMYQVYEDNILVYTRPRQATTSTSFTFPHGIIRNNVSLYEVVLRVWDTFPRATIDDDRDYVGALRTFTFNVGDTDPINDDLTVVDVDGHVHITWTRDTEPDYYAVVIDGEIVQEAIPGADLHVAGIEYALDFFRAQPYDTATYAIHAIEDLGGDVLVHSGDNPTTVHTFQPTGIWLADETDGTEVLILGTDAVSSQLGEEGTTYFVLGRRDPIRSVDSLRGYEGTVSGTLAFDSNTDANEWHDRWAILKARVEQPLRLTYGHRNIPVLIGETQDELVQVGEELYHISFEFWQIDEFEIGEEAQWPI